MRSLLKLSVLCSFAVGWTSAAVAGAGALSVEMKPLSDNVTYSIQSPAMPTYVGYTIKFGNSGGNTINNISFTVTARATDTTERVELFSGLPAGCSKNPSDARQFSCTIGQLKAQEPFPEFTVFYTAPQKASTAPAVDNVDLHMTVVYAERFGGATSPPQNSIKQFDTAETVPPGSVRLGTINPLRIKSSVPKDLAVSLYTGEAGIPKLDNKATMLAAIPALTAVTTADLEVEPNSDPDNCLTQGRFTQCPTYTVTIPGTLLPYLSMTYRIDASALKMSPAKTLNSVQIHYSDDGVNYVPVPLTCPNNTPTNDGVPCVLFAQCYKSNYSIVNLRGDCEWILINTRNGLTRFR